MTVQNSDLANQTQFNDSFMSREQDTSTIGKVDLNQPDTTTIADVQNFINALRTQIGNLLATANEGDTPDWTSIDANGDIVGGASDSLTDKIVSIVLLFLGAGGHTHDGTDGNGPLIDLVSAVNGILGVENGGTGLNASSAANGEILIGNGSGFDLLTISGTSNQVTVTNGPGSITLSLPQDIHSGATPSFAQISLSTGATNPNHVYTKQQIDNLLDGLKWKKNAITADLSGGGTFASDFDDGDTVGGHVVSTGDRILLAGRATLTENGIFEVQASGAPVRASDADTESEVTAAAISILFGNDAGKIYQQTEEITDFATDAQDWIQGAGFGLYTVDGNAIQELITRQFSLVLDGSTLTQSASGLKTNPAVVPELAIENTFTDKNTFQENFVYATTNRSDAGSNVNLAAVATSVIQLISGALVSVEGLAGGEDGLVKLLVNQTGVEIELLHDQATSAADGFLLPDGSPLPLKPDAGAFLIYSSRTSRWHAYGGAAADLTNVAFLNQSQTFTGVQTFSNNILASARLAFDDQNINDSGTAVNLSNFSDIVYNLNSLGLVSIAGMPRTYNGECRILHNSNSNPVTILHDSASASSTNDRFYLPNNEDFDIPEEGMAMFVYSERDFKWHLVGSTGGGTDLSAGFDYGITIDSTSTGNTTISDPGTPIIEFTNSGLTRINAFYDAGSLAKYHIFSNRTGNPIEILHETVISPQTGFHFSDGVNYVLRNNESVAFYYSDDLNRWVQVGAVSQSGRLKEPDTTGTDLTANTTGYTVVAGLSSGNFDERLDRQISEINITTGAGNPLNNVEEMDPGTIFGQELVLRGDSALGTKTIQFFESSGAGYECNGDFFMTSGSMISFYWDENNLIWREMWRRG